MYIIDSNQYAIELVTYLWVLVVYFYELIELMLSERNASDSIAFFSQCEHSTLFRITLLTTIHISLHNVLMETIISLLIIASFLNKLISYNKV